MNKKIEFGDFQTPINLTLRCVERVKEMYTPDIVWEPTCGRGNFLEASYNVWKNTASYKGHDINENHLQDFQKRCPRLFKLMDVNQSDIFTLNFFEILQKSHAPLIIGNPPWVTNSKIGSLNGDNLPKKNNEANLRGIEALTGKSNFDISEHIIFKATDILKEKRGFLAMICKLSVARNIFLKNFKRNHKNVNYKIIKIDAKKEFNASVDACFFICDYCNGGDETICEIYNSFNEKHSSEKMGVLDEKIVANIDLYKQTKDAVKGTTNRMWRSGIKHDCSKVMELIFDNGKFINGFMEIVDIENEYIFPLLKSSDLANNRTIAKKYIIIPQKKIGENTAYLKETAPKLWKYLLKYSSLLDLRKSSIYKNGHRFSIFGIGEYSFKPFKIAISGLYKTINFCLIEPKEGKPVMLDDTCYLIAFETKEEALDYFKILNSELVKGYMMSLIFWDAKRPINSQILKSVDVLKASHFYHQYQRVELNNERIM